MTLRKTLAGIAAAAAVLASAPTNAGPCPHYNDLTQFDEADPFCTSVVWLHSRLITQGCGGGAYCPANPVSRAQMALFMSRLGKAFTPRRFFVDQNPGPVTIQGDASQVVCQTTDLPLPNIGDGHRRTATLHGLVWGVVNSSVTWTADIWYSIDEGVTWKPITNFIPSRTAAAGTMTDGATFAVMEIPAGANAGGAPGHRFGILVRESQDLPAGTGNFTDLACHLMVEVGNSEPGLAPLPPTPPPPCDARLGGSGLLQPNLGCE